MRTLLAFLLVVAIAVPAFAGDNPSVRLYVDFDPGMYIHRVDPAMYTAFDAYFMLDCFTGITGVSFMVSNTPGMSSPAAYEPLLPGGLAIGGFETGVTVVSSECVVVEPVAVAVGHYFYLNLPGDIMIVDHPDFPRWVVDCNDQVDPYCVFMHGGVAKDAIVGDPGCDGVINPVENSSWGGIKALYR